MSTSELLAIVQKYLPLNLLLREDKRKRSWPSVETACTFLRQVLNPGQPCREAVRASNVGRVVAKRSQVSDNTAAYCKARRKLPERILEIFWKHLAHITHQSAQEKFLWKSRKVAVVDGSSFSMPDTASNQSRYPQPSQQKKGCGFPVVRVVGVFSLITGAIHGYSKGTLHDPERTLFRTLWPIIKEQFDLLIGDRGFCSFADMYFLFQFGVDTAIRIHQGRDVNWREGKRIGKYDRLVQWKKPRTQLKWLTSKQYSDLPETWTVRIVRVQVKCPGFRTQTLIVATTLLDPAQFSAADIAELYGLRWSVELFLRHNKTTLRMDILRCLSPEMIHREIHMHWIAYNLARNIMLEAALAGNIPISRISFKGTIDTLRQWLPALHSVAKKPRIFRNMYSTMLQTIASDPVPLRPDRFEPRAVKRRPKKFKLLNKPRRIMKELMRLHQIPKTPK
jgi:hypothetical protein